MKKIRFFLKRLCYFSLAISLIMLVPNSALAHETHPAQQIRKISDVKKTKNLKQELKNNLFKGIKVESLDDLLKNKKAILKNFKKILQDLTDNPETKKEIEQVISELKHFSFEEAVPLRPNDLNIKLPDLDVFNPPKPSIVDGNTLFAETYETILKNLIENYQRYDTNEKGEEVLDWEADLMADSTTFAPAYFFTLSEDLAKEPNADPALVASYWTLAQKTVMWQEKVWNDILSGRVDLMDPTDPAYNDPDYYFSFLAFPAIVYGAKYLQKPKYIFTSSLLLSFTSLILKDRELSEDLIWNLQSILGVDLGGFGKYEFLVGMIAMLDMECYLATGKKIFANFSISILDNLWEEQIDPQTGKIREVFKGSLEDLDIYSSSAILTALARQYEFTNNDQYVNRAQEIVTALDKWSWKNNYKTYNLYLSADVGLGKSLVDMYGASGDLSFITRTIRLSQYLENELYFDDGQTGPMLWHHLEGNGERAQFFCTGDNFLFLYNTYLMKEFIQKRGDIVPLVISAKEITPFSPTDLEVAAEFELKNYSDFSLTNVIAHFPDIHDSTVELGDFASGDVKIISGEIYDPLIFQFLQQQWDGQENFVDNLTLEADLVPSSEYHLQDKLIFGFGGDSEQDPEPEEEKEIVSIATNTAEQFNPCIYENKIVWEDSRNGNSDIYMYDLTTGQERQITTDTDYQENPAIYADKVVWEDKRNGNSDIYLYDLTTGQETPITTNTADQSDPAIYIDKIVWEDKRNGNSDIYMYDLTTGQETQITTNTVSQYDPAIYSDKIVWEDKRNGNSDIYMYDLTTGQETPITTNTASQYGPAIYADKIVWADYRNDGYADIYMYDLTTGQETPITTNTASQYGPAIYADKIVWADKRNGNSDIYMHDLTMGQ